ncbi:hypothetical protein D1641_17310 [Colidextribacter sp. OB.20]|uniref:hypothetical protein n=1 Tax=Colidextribacter sp. OB.20 TaxID=2304568 RepID=UPI0013712FBA|nr:hypothetical protein [Colidextribacter sp. OB.20]NBI11727.1 hypothetical protein [Colidextribacter sp. OB.20]
MNATTNYQLNQWEASDRVLRTDFNADNAKIEAALSGLEERAAALDRLATNIAYQAGQLGIVDQAANRRGISCRGMVCEAFVVSSGYDCTGGVVVANDKASLTGAGAVGTVTAERRINLGTDMTHCKLWLHCSGDRVTPTVNGQSMEKIRSFYDPSSAHSTAVCFEYTCSGLPVNRDCIITLEMECKTGSPVEVYDFWAVFY